MEDRHYQIQFVKELREKVEEGKIDIAGVGPTGSGKTVMAAMSILGFLPSLKKNQKILFIADSYQLVIQAINKFAQFGIKCGAIVSGFKEDRTAPVQVATVHSLASRQSIDWLVVKYLYVDEAHTTSWYGECRRFRREFPSIPFFHLTATPDRTAADEEMGDICDSIVCAPMPWELIEMGYLVRPTYYGLKDLTEAIETDSPEGLELAASEYHRIAAGKPGIIFAKNVIHAKAIADAVCRLGYRAAAVDGDLSPKAREAFYKGLADGTWHVLTSAELLVKGFDCPPAWYCGLWRNTKSAVIARQQMGRVLRTCEGKHGCAIVDAVGLTSPSKFGRVEDITISALLKSEERLKGEIRTKTCPSCKAIHPIFVSKCGCGYPFSMGKKDTAQFNTLERLCLLMAPADVPKMQTYRQWLRSAFLQGDRPETARLKYIEKFRAEPPEEWRRGAVFGDCAEEGDKKAYWDYLGNIPIEVKESLMNSEFGSFGNYTFLSAAPTLLKKSKSRRTTKAKTSDPTAFTPSANLPPELAKMLKNIK